jgi:hypothetical protein
VTGLDCPKCAAVDRSATERTHLLQFGWIIDLRPRSDGASQFISNWVTKYFSSGGLPVPSWPPS